MKPFFCLLLFVFVLFSLKADAQQAEKLDPAHDNKEVRGFIIHLIPSPGGGFGFTVMKDKIMMWSQLTNPFIPGTQAGFTHKADAYKLADWVISEKEKDNRTPLRLPASLAKQLDISERLPK